MKMVTNVVLQDLTLKPLELNAEKKISSTFSQMLGYTFLFSKMISLLRRIVPYLDQMFVSGGSFLTIAIGANKLSLVEQGKLGYVLALVMVTTLLQGTLIHQMAAVRFPRRKNQRLYQQSLVMVCLCLAIITACLLSGALFFLAHSASWLISSKTLFLLFNLLILQQSADFLRKSAYYAHHQNKALLVSALMYPLRIVLLLTTPIKVVDDVMTLSIISCVLPLLWFTKDLKGVHLYPIKQLLRIGVQHLKGSLQLEMLAVINWLWNYIPFFLLGTIHGAQAAAVLASMRSLSNLFNIVLEVLETSFASKFSKVYFASSGWKRMLRKEYLSGFILWLAGLIGLLYLHRLIVPMILGSNFEKYEYLIILLWIPQIFIFVFRVQNVRLRTMGAASLIIWANLLTLVIVASTSWNVIKTYGIDGTVYIFIFAPVVVIAGQFVGMRLNRRLR